MIFILSSNFENIFHHLKNDKIILVEKYSIFIAKDSKFNTRKIINIAYCNQSII